MKFFLAVTLLLVPFSDAFTITSTRRALTMMASTLVDSADLVAEALAVSKKFGASSPEARLAWETVEEVDASDNSAAFMGSLVDEYDAEAVSKDCLEYNDALVQLQELVKANAPSMSTLSMIVTSSVKQIKLAAPETGAAPNNQALQDALAEARKITDEEGITSSTAAVAWETVEEIAAADGNSNAIGAGLLDVECFIEAAQEACAALEELNRVMESRKE